MAYQPSHHRTRLIKLIHVAKRDLGLDEDTYRNVLHNIAGKASSTELTLEELREVLEFFRQKGWKPQHKNGGQKLSPPSKPNPTPQDKIRAMWISMAKEGLIRNPSETALNAFVRRITRVANVTWLTHKQCSVVIHALRAIENRSKNHASNTTGTDGGLRPELQPAGVGEGAAPSAGHAAQEPDAG